MPHEHGRVIYIAAMQASLIAKEKILGGLSIRNGQNRSHFAFSQKSESHHRSRSHFATPMMM